VGPLNYSRCDTKHWLPCTITRFYWCYNGTSRVPYHLGTWLESHEIEKNSVVTGIKPTTSGLLDQRRSRSDNQAPLVVMSSSPDWSENFPQATLPFDRSYVFYNEPYIPTDARCVTSQNSSFFAVLSAQTTVCCLSFVCKIKQNYRVSLWKMYFKTFFQW